MHRRTPHDRRRSAGRRGAGAVVWWSTVVALVATSCSYSRTEIAPVIPTISQSSQLFAADGSLITVLHAEQNRELVTFDQLPPHLVEAVIAIEDKRFWDHDGVDIQAILRATKTNAEAGGIAEGGSTITQQYVKNAMLDPSQTVNRKLREISLAWQVERNFSKELILELYLNTIYFGHGAYGVQAAAQSYFGKPVTEITLPEAALLAGLIQRPSATDPYLAPEAAVKRRDVVLEQMLGDGRITVAEQLAARNTPLQLREEFEAVDRFPAAHFVEEVKQFVLTDPRFGETEEQRRDLLFGGGLRIHTTIDLRLQALAEQAVAEVLPDPEVQPDGALVAMDPATGRVLAMAGGRDYFGASPYSKVNLAMGAGRQAGSSFKPFVLAAAVEKNISLGRVYKAPPQMEFVIDRAQEPWTVRNYGGSGGGSANLIEATVRSYNTVYAQLMLEVGPEAAVRVAQAMGVTSPLTPVPAAVLGTENVTVLEMANAYATLANRGVHVAPVFVDLITDSSGDVLYEAPLAQTRALKAETADQLTAAMQQVISRGTGTAAQIDRPAAGKTGTAEEYRDAWFVGYTPQLSVAVWVGYPQQQVPMVPPTTAITVTGGSWPAQIWRAFTAAALEDAEVIGFTPPATRVNAYSGPPIGDTDGGAGGSTTTTAPGTSTTTGRPGPGTSTPGTGGGDGTGGGGQPTGTTAAPPDTQAPPTTEPPTTAPPPTATSSPAQPPPAVNTSAAGTPPITAGG